MSALSCERVLVCFCSGRVEKISRLSHCTCVCVCVCVCVQTDAHACSVLCLTDDGEQQVLRPAGGWRSGM